jgi:DNA-binding NtrC family response regulator
LLLIERGPAGARWRPALAWAVGNPRPHIILFTGRANTTGVPGIVLKRLSPEALIEATQPQPLAGAIKRRVEAAARSSEGIPGRFVRLLFGWKEGVPGGHGTVAFRLPRGGAARSKAAERSPAYGDGQLARRMNMAIERLGEGRRASGDRLLRQAVGGYSRRQDWSQALRGQLILAQSLLKRGRPHDAQEVLAEGKECAAQAGESGQDGVLLEFALLSGIACTDLARLEEAETILHTAVAAAGDGVSASAKASSRLALARCLFWRGQFPDAERALSGIDLQLLADPALVAFDVAASRIAVGRGALAESIARATAALDRARRTGEPSLVADAACAAAFAHLSVGDRPGVQDDLKTCVQAARASHDPLRALRARLIDAESARRTGQSAPGSALLARIRRLSGPRLPVTIGARCALLGDLLASAPPAEAVKRHVASTGLGALALFAPTFAAGDTPISRQALDDVMEVLRCCQKAEDEEEVLREVCSQLRTSFRAVSVAFFAPERLAAPVVADGSRIEIGIAERVSAARQPIVPHLIDGRIEGGAPVVYGGDTIGALVARWHLAGALDTARASTSLALAATAAAPALAAVLLRRANQGEGDDLVGVGTALADIRRAVERAAAAPFAVLVTGESGSGKELVARALHRRSPRRTRPFCTLNCAALPDDLVEAELFGHSRGAFTGAVAERPGVFEEAHTGTLFLDEVGELSLRAQAKLLRVIQEGELRRIGENMARRVDVRIVSATNRDLKGEAAAGRFRLDLLYRLDVIRIGLPPLRERRQDVAALAERFWREATEQMGSRATLAASTIAALARYDWPGNVRELQNVLAALAVRSPKRGVIPPTALPPAFHEGDAARSWRLDAARRTFEEQFVRAALVRSGGTRSRAAGELGVTRQGLSKLMRRLGISEG